MSRKARWSGGFDPWRRNLRTQGLDLLGYLRQGRACLCHAGVFGANEAGVGGYRLAHPLDGAVQLSIKLSPYDFAQALPESLGLLAELFASLAPSARQDKEPEARARSRRSGAPPLSP